MNRRTLSTGIAVVGADCCFSNGLGLEDFWESCRTGTHGVRELPPERWQAAAYMTEEALPSRWRAGFLAPTALELPWQQLRIPPRQVQRMHPMDRVLFRVITRALGHAGHGTGRTPPGRETALFVGSMGPMLDPTDPRILGFRRHEVLQSLEATAALRSLPAARREALLERVERMLAEGQRADEGDVSGSASILAGRIAGLLDLHGMHMAVDAEAASALAALDIACRGLLAGDFDTAIVAAISPWLSPLTFELYGRLGLLETPLCGNGLELGEGGGAVVLKRASEAQRAGDRVLAVIRGLGLASHGRARLPDSPCADTVARAMEEALGEAGWKADSVDYVECHAGEVPTWQQEEQEAISRVFPGRRPTLGSVQAATGYTLSASGMSGLLHAIWRLGQGPAPGEPGSTRRAGVTSWGLGGLAAHVLLEAPGEVPAETAPPRRERLELAITRMGGVFPGAPDVPSLWRNILGEVSAISEVPAERWDPTPFYDADKRPGRIYTRLGGFLAPLSPREVELPLSPRRLERLDRGVLHAARAARQLVEGEGPVEPLRTGVVLADMDWRAAELSPALWLSFLGLRGRLRQTLLETGLTASQADEVLREATQAFRGLHPPPTEDTLPGQLGSASAGTVAHLCNLRGPAFVVESTCASSLASLYVAAQQLETGRCDRVLCGGVFTNTTPEYYLANCSFGALSAQGIFPFDTRADGFVLGEGVGLVMLRRAGDAERDGDPIHALVRGIGGSSDGGSRSVLAPDPTGQALAIRRALEQSGVQPDSVRFIECHGAGTALGDASEVTAYADAYAGRSTPLGLTSIKSMIGHLSSAAGVAGLIKATLAVSQGILPPSLGFQQPSENVPFERGSFEVLTKPRPWEEPGPRRAGVSAFGLGGSNFHVILEAPSPREPLPRQKKDETGTNTVPPGDAGRAPRAMGSGLEGTEGGLLWLLVQHAADSAPERPVREVERLQLLDPRRAMGRKGLEVSLRVERTEEDGGLSRCTVRVEQGDRTLARAILRLGEPGAARGAEDLARCTPEDLEACVGAVHALARGPRDPAPLVGLSRLYRGSETRTPCVRRVGRELHVDLTVPSRPQGSGLPFHLEGARLLLPLEEEPGEPFLLTDGAVADRSASPLLTRLLERTDTGFQLLRTVSVESEPYLLDHQLEGVPVIPGAVHCETLVEGARLLRPGATVVSVEKLFLPLAVRVPREASMDLRVVAEGTTSEVKVSLRSDFVDAQGRTLVRDRLHATALIRFGEVPAPRYASIRAAALPWLEQGGSSIDSCYGDEQSHMGPRLRCLRWLRIFGKHELLACILLPAPHDMFAHVAAPRYGVNPFLLDGCFQAAGVLGAQIHHRASLPAGAGRLEVLAAPEESRPLFVHARYLPSQDEELAHYELEAFDSTGRLLWRVEDYQTFLLWPLSGTQSSRLENAVADGRVNERLAPQRGSV